ncbi:hypothetical protein niasHS_009737 [Heterodera schachtii]|uniref:Secreted protein n=1 Tax=Heterodera schachtii TaxID=97005 RepID=A0ABD2J563_HETSC
MTNANCLCTFLLPMCAVKSSAGELSGGHHLPPHHHPPPMLRTPFTNLRHNCAIPTLNWQCFSLASRPDWQKSPTIAKLKIGANDDEPQNDLSLPPECQDQNNRS